MEQILTVIVDGIIYSAWLFVAAIGLTLIYGVMKIVNLTHGSFYALGAYAAASFTGAWIARGYLERVVVNDQARIQLAGNLCIRIAQ